LTGAVCEAIFEAIAFWVLLKCSSLTCFGSFCGRAAWVLYSAEAPWKKSGCLEWGARRLHARFLRWGRADKSPDDGRLSSEDELVLLGDGWVPTVCRVLSRCACGGDGGGVPLTMVTDCPFTVDFFMA
jgi:hypothetical protein